MLLGLAEELCRDLADEVDRPSGPLYLHTAFHCPLGIYFQYDRGIGPDPSRVVCVGIGLGKMDHLAIGGFEARLQYDVRLLLGGGIIQAIGYVVGRKAKVQIDRMAIRRPDQVRAALIPSLGVGLDERDDVMRPQPVIPRIVLLYGIYELTHGDESLLVHVQSELFGEVAQRSCHRTAYPLQLLVAHEELAWLATHRAGIPSEITMDGTLTQHSAGIMGWCA